MSHPVDHARSVLGIDAAWTLRNPSGVALIAESPSGWRLAAVAGSYDSFIGRPSAGLDQHADPAALIAACVRLVGQAPDLVAVDMPLARHPIERRRASDDAVSRAYGARHCSTHTPSAERPGKISGRMTAAFEQAGYPLATSRIDGRALIEVYPHPALVELSRAERRLPYKVQKIRAYWPELTPAERRLRLSVVWANIVERLEGQITGVATALVIPSPIAPGRDWKSFEDKLDAVVCA
ncbi:MAG: hypothetical protein JWM33_903 [Caulobacteraceae bacterium]|nr:hypothetical protein [Caulobacteraceae bacterium]